VKVDRATKRRMAKFRDINRSEVVRDAIRRRLDAEEAIRRPTDRRRAAEAARRMDVFRARVGRGEYDSARDIGTWRDARRRS